MSSRKPREAGEAGASEAHGADQATDGSVIFDSRNALGKLAKDLRRVSLDYVQVSLESHHPEVHDKMVGVSGAWRETTNSSGESVRKFL